MSITSFFSRRVLPLVLLGGALTFVAPIGVALAGPPPAAATGAEAIAVLDRVQAFYDKTTTFRANFKQTYVVRATGVRKSSVGTVVFKKPGRMNWRYTNNGNRVVSDSQVIKVYEKENNQMFVQPVSKGQQHRAALAFLLGGAKLKDSFTCTLQKAIKFEGGHVLECLPKEKTPAYSKMLLFVDGRTAQVRRVLLIDAQGNRNTFDFEAPVVNKPVEETEFQFTPPTGTRVIKP